MSEPLWQEQWARVNRLLSRVRKIGQTRQQPFDVDRQFDDVYAFFLNCFHLKDWLKADPEFDAAKKEKVESYLSSSASLAICADIANASKHLKLDRRRSEAHPGRMVAEVVETSFRRKGAADFEPAGEEVTFYVEHNSRLLSVVDLAESAVRDWDSFLS